MMRVTRIDPLEAKAEGTCFGLPYDTQLASRAGVSIHFWVGDAYDDAIMREAIAAARRSRDIVRATWSLGQPTGFWNHHDIRS